MKSIVSTAFLIAVAVSVDCRLPGDPEPQTDIQPALNTARAQPSNETTLNREEQAQMEEIQSKRNLLRGSIQCNFPYITVGDRCLMFSTKKLNWMDAKKYCYDNEAKLVVLDTWSESIEFLSYYLRNYACKRFWLGASIMDAEGTWKWITGKPVTHDQFPWMCGMPDNYRGNEDCLEIGYKSGYNDGSCSKRKRYVCEKEPSCPSGMFRLPSSNQCFKLTSTALTWSSGLTSCASEGLVIAQPADNIAAALRKYLLETYGEKYIWVGGRGDGSKQAWDRDGAAVGSELLYPGAEKEGTTNRCLSMYANHAGVNLYPSRPYTTYWCTYKRRVLCEDVECPEGFFKSASKCYKFIDNSSNWTAANDACSKLGLVLAEPSDPLKLRADLLDIYKRKAGWVWLGARGNGVNIKWQRSGEVLPLDSPLWHPQIRDRQQYLSSTFCLQTRAEWHQVENFPTEPFYSYRCNGGANAVCEY